MSLAALESEGETPCRSILNRLLEKAYYTEKVQYASQSFERALRKFEDMTNIGTREFELGQVSPDEVDEQWVRERLAHRLIYYCESEGRAPPTLHRDHRHDLRRLEAVHDHRGGRAVVGQRRC